MGQGGSPRTFLHPCTLGAHREEHQLTTILGSCVAVCLWDAQRGVGGMNHYMLPLWNGEGLPTPKYGNIAIERLVTRMLDLGSRKGDLVAKVFGGAKVLAAEGPSFGVGSRNIAVAQELLATHRISTPVLEVGGNLGLRILFNTRTGVVLLKRLTPGDPAAGALPDGRPKAAGILIGKP